MFQTLNNLKMVRRCLFVVCGFMLHFLVIIVEVIETNSTREREEKMGKNEEKQSILLGFFPRR